MTPGNVRARIAAAGTAVTGTGAAASLALALLVLVCAFVAVAVPRASLGYRTAVLQRSFHAASSSTTTVLADATINGLSGGSLSAAQLASAQRQLIGRPGPRRPAAGAGHGRLVRHGHRLGPVHGDRPGPGPDHGRAPAGTGLPQRAGPQHQAGRGGPARRRRGAPAPAPR